MPRSQQKGPSAFKFKSGWTLSFDLPGKRWTDHSGIRADVAKRLPIEWSKDLVNPYSIKNGFYTIQLFENVSREISLII